jgi:transposase-like protein
MSNSLYSDDFKKGAVQKLLGPNSLGLSGTARHLGLPLTTLFAWKKKMADGAVMKNTSTRTLPRDWTPEEKMEAVNKTYHMTENQLGEYLRASGLTSCDLETFKKEFLSGAPGRGRPKLDPEIVQLRTENKALKKDLNHKDKALAEVSARIVLLKKSQLLWGEREDDE